jgi:hypothetical protein
VVVTVGETVRVLVDVPAATGVPPQEPVYHLKVVPAPPAAEIVVDEPLQIVSAVADADVGAVGRRSS